MGISLIFFAIIIFIIFIIIVMTFLFQQEGKSPSPFNFSMIVFAGLTLQIGAYSLLPIEVSDALFFPVWVLLGAAGLLAGAFEYKSNTAAALGVTGLSIISVFVNGISKV
ncbi:hypothetical protein [Halobacillus sp. Marseille-Q1614]|uniref:hypothetical protein n=1 Tax=Halobacillus sp. Marseille-Q1614 TaxID=2709134 RepID=UPI00156F8BD5|nr:hypothetical protein [Halobacillus sp. Marseille-Q1614]